jgi:hypothetical protein
MIDVDRHHIAYRAFRMKKLIYTEGTEVATRALRNRSIAALQYGEDEQRDDLNQHTRS